MAKHAAETTSHLPKILAIFTAPEFRKFQVVVIGVAVAAATAGLLPAAVSTWVLLIVGVLTATGVYAAPNAPQKLVLQAPGTPAQPADVVVAVEEPALTTEQWMGVQALTSDRKAVG